METKPELSAVIGNGDYYIVLITNIRKPIAFYLNTKTGIQPLGQKGESFYDKEHFEKKCILYGRRAYPLTPHGGKVYEYAMRAAERITKTKKSVFIKTKEDSVLT